MQKIKVLRLLSQLKQKRILIQFFYVFCLLIIVPVAITNNLNYYNSSKVIEEEINQYNDQILGNLIEGVDTKLWNICSSVAVIPGAECFDSVFRKTGRAEHTAAGKLDIDKMREQLKELKKTDPIIEEASVYFISDDAIVSNDGFYDFDTYFKYKKCYDGLSSGDWRQILQKKHSFELLGGHTVHEKTPNSDIQSRMITMLSSAPGYSDPQATVMIFINQNSINNIISEYAGIRKNDYFVTDLNGNTIAEYANNRLLNASDIRKIAADTAGRQEAILHKTLDNGRLSITCAVSPLTNWVYITAAPLKEIYKQSFYIRNSTLIICAACIILGLLIAVILSRVMYRPISNIVDYINNTGITGDIEKAQNDSNLNEYKLIIKHLDKILEANRILKSSFDKDIPFLSDNLFYRILHNSVASEAEVLQSMEKLGISFDKEYLIVLSVRLDALNLADDSGRFKSEVYDISDRIIDVIYSMLRQKYSCYHVNAGVHSSFIVNFDSAAEEEFIGLCEEIVHFFSPEEYRQRICIGIGGKCTRISSLSESYNQSVKALSYITFSGRNQLVLFDEGLMDNFSKLFDTDIDLKPLYNSLLAGEFDRGVALAHGIIDDCAAKRFPYEQMNKIAIQIIHTAVSALDIKGYSLADAKLDKSYIYKVEGFVLIDEYKKHISDVFGCIGELANNRYNGRKGEIVGHITRYVNDNYNKDIYLDSIADELGMSTNYLSHFFKEITGVSFPDYLGRVRVEKSKKLLEATDKPINEICAAVGCMNINTFIRLFKKVEGITPGRYRELLAKADGGAE